MSVITPTTPDRVDLRLDLHHDLEAQTVACEWLIGLDREHVGPAIVRNQLAAQASTDWLAFCDDDDRFAPNHLETLVRAQHETGADIVYTLCKVSGRAWEPEHDCTHEHLAEVNTVPVTALVRKTLFDQVGGFPTDHHNEDHRLWQELLKIGARFACVHERTWTYQFHGKNRSLGA